MNLLERLKGAALGLGIGLGLVMSSALAQVLNPVTVINGGAVVSSGNPLNVYDPSVVAAIVAATLQLPVGVYQASVSVYSAVGGTGNALLTGTAIAASATPHTLTGFSFDNIGNSAASYIQFFDLATGSVTLGTTVPKFVVVVPPGGYVDDPVIAGVTFATALTVAATITRTGASSPANGVAATIYFK